MQSVHVHGFLKIGIFEQEFASRPNFMKFLPNLLLNAILFKICQAIMRKP